MLENTAQLQAEALGILGVNLIHGASLPPYYTSYFTPRPIGSFVEMYQEAAQLNRRDTYRTEACTERHPAAVFGGGVQQPSHQRPPPFLQPNMITALKSEGPGPSSAQAVRIGSH